MSDLLSGVMVFAVLTTIAIICLIMLLNRLYKTEVVKAKFIRERVHYGNFNHVDHDYNIHVDQYFEFETKKGDKKTLEFTYSLLKKGKSRLLMYNEDKDKLTGKFISIFVLAPLFVVISWMILSLDIYMLIGYVLIIPLTVYIYIRNYNKPKEKEKKKKRKGERK